MKRAHIVAITLVTLVVVAFWSRAVYRECRSDHSIVYCLWLAGK